VDERTGRATVRIFPLDKHENADSRRRVIQHDAEPEHLTPPADGVAPLLREMLEDYAATGLPPGYIPKDEDTYSQQDTDEEETP
jgi:putative transposase